MEVGRHYLEEAWGQRLMTLSQFLDDYILPHYYEAASRGGGSSVGSAWDSAAHVQEQEQQEQEQQEQEQEQEQQQQRHPTGYLAQHPLFEQIRELQLDIRCAARGAHTAHHWIAPCPCFAALEP